jgi:hypothetical protein
VRGSKFVFGAVIPGATKQEDVLAKVSRPINGFAAWHATTLICVVSHSAEQLRITISAAKKEVIRSKQQCIFVSGVSALSTAEKWQRDKGRLRSQEWRLLVHLLERKIGCQG